MAETSWPGPGPATVTEHMHELLWSAYYQSGLVGDVGQTPLIYADSTGLVVKARAGRYALVRGQVWSSGDTDVEIPITANDSGATRLDRIVLRLDRATWQVRLTVVHGVPGGGEPAIEQDPGPSGAWDLWVATVTVSNGAVTVNPGDVRPRNARIGPPLIIADGSDLPDPSVPRAFLRYRADEDRLILHRQGASTSGQVDLWHDSGEILLTESNGNWAGSTTSLVRRVGNWVYLRYGSKKRTGSRLSSGTNSTLPGVIPPELRSRRRDHYVPVMLSGHRIGRIRIPYANNADAPGRILLVTHSGMDRGDSVWTFSTSWPI